MENPKITVVTVCYNAVDTIEKTMLSVINQTYPNIEYIIIDGASTDGTVDIIQKYRDKIAYFLSEPDKGIYDAMNKGIKAATGEWINFMNAGDSFHNSYVTYEFVKIADEKYDIIYGSIIKMLPDIHYQYDPYPLEMMDKCMILPHQGTFIKAEFHKIHLFDVSYKSSGDYHFFYNAYYTYGAKFQQTDIVVADFDESAGMSKINIKTARMEDLRIWSKEHCSYAVIRMRLRILYWYFIHYLNMILPHYLLILLRNYRLRKQGFSIMPNLEVIA